MPSLTVIRFDSVYSMANKGCKIEVCLWGGLIDILCIIAGLRSMTGLTVVNIPNYLFSNSSITISLSLLLCSLAARLEFD